MVGRSMYKTKLCILYKRGRCSRPNCSFAHGNAELRRIPDVPYGGGRNSRVGDLRDKLDRRLSFGQRVSPGRGFRGYNASRSIERHRNRERRGYKKFDGQSDYAESSRGTDRFEDQPKDGRNAFLSTKNVFEEKLKKVQLDVDMLNSHKLSLGDCIEEKAQEADSLKSRIQELEIQLEKEKVECKRIISGVKKFVKEYNRFLRTQDELKRSQARVQKLGNQLGADVTRADGNEGDLNIDIVSDEKNAGYGAQNLQSSTSLTKKRRRGNQDTAEVSVDAAMLRDDGGGATVRPKKLSRWNYDQVLALSENGVLVSNKGYEGSMMGDEKQKGKFLTGNKSSVLKMKATGSSGIVPSTSLSGHAFDEVTEYEDGKRERPVAEEAEGKTSLECASVLPPPPNPALLEPENVRLHEGNEEPVDVDGL